MGIPGNSAGELLFSPEFFVNFAYSRKCLPGNLGPLLDGMQYRGIPTCTSRSRLLSVISFIMILIPKVPPVF